MKNIATLLAKWNVDLLNHNNKLGFRGITNSLLTQKCI